MCRGGKDGQIKRCKVNDRQQATANLRKKVKYRADKDGISTEEWKEQNQSELKSLLKEVFPVSTDVTFQPVSEKRTLAEGIPDSIAEHIEMSKKHIDSILSPDEQKALAGYTGFGAGVANSVLLRGKIDDQDLYDKAPDSWRGHEDPPCDFSNREDLQDYLETMDGVLSKRQEEQRVLYRGMPIYTGLHEEFEKAIGQKIYVTDDVAMMKGIKAYYEPGKVLDFPSYISTTHSAYYAADRTQNDTGTNNNYYEQSAVKGIVFEMKTNAGLDVTAMARHHAHEREVVLPRDTRFRIESVDLRPEAYDTVSGFDRIKRPEQRKEKTFTNLAVVVQLVEVDKDGNDILHTEPHQPSALNLGQ